MAVFGIHPEVQPNRSFLHDIGIFPAEPVVEPASTIPIATKCPPCSAVDPVRCPQEFRRLAEFGARWASAREISRMNWIRIESVVHCGTAALPDLTILPRDANIGWNLDLLRHFDEIDSPIAIVLRSLPIPRGMLIDDRLWITVCPMLSAERILLFWDDVL
ncbi:hypothetical protein HacjB3_16916 (plasmid) [Halalkalicoccus jeotgali B3]|uniref:Uncharacterized protein n=1 Tax=Halalkalicoccus jeotgali (strain DSM 18796 / CECT 7217 / JCM 14584 / KCTC 4019 / B3) TaxID=795797 RepID=D8JBT0_HALJB|nr:hypothetical protein HacjB3_16916 [Halalkalicoccus jeotgali B3]